MEVSEGGQMTLHRADSAAAVCTCWSHASLCILFAAHACQRDAAIGCCTAHCTFMAQHSCSLRCALTAQLIRLNHCRGYQHFSSASTPEASALTVAAAPASPNGPASPSRASPLSHTAAGALSPLSNPPQLPLASQAPQLMLPHEASTLSTRRNSLPPLRTGTTSMSGANASSSNSSGAAATPAGFNSASGGAAKATAALAAASLDLDRNGSSGRPASPGSILGLASTGPESDRTAAGVQNVGGEVSGMLEGPLQISSSFARMRSCSSALGPSAGSTVVDVAAMGQLAAVRQVQAMAHR